MLFGSLAAWNTCRARSSGMIASRPPWTMQQRRLDRADAVDGAVLVGHDQAEREALPHQPADIDDRGERRFEHERLDMALERKPGRDRGAERLAVSDDVVRRDAEPAQVS